MGLIKNLIGGEDYPELPLDSYAVRRIDKVRGELTQLVSETNDRVEIVPGERSAYVFIGKPPKKFGMAWITDGQLTNLGELAQQRNFSPITLEKIEDRLAEAYRRSESDQRYTVTVGGEKVIVAPSSDLENEVHRIIQELLE